MKAKMYNIQKWIKISDEKYLKQTFNDILKKSGFNIEKQVHKIFKPYGYTGLWLLSESHFAVHTFPEKNKTYIELSSCVKKPYKKFNKICNKLKIF